MSRAVIVEDERANIALRFQLDERDPNGEQWKLIVNYSGNPVRPDARYEARDVIYQVALSVLGVDGPRAIA